MKQFDFERCNSSDVLLVHHQEIRDGRGSFLKAFSENIFAAEGIRFEVKETYFSRSRKGVLRGMHFQREPFGHAKLVTVVLGEILDVSVGVNGHTFGKTFSARLSDSNNTSAFVPQGYAHGFLVLSESAVVLCHMSSGFNLAAEQGVHWNSFGFSWPVAEPILSSKDQEQPLLDSFKNIDRMFLP
jgi:dTDP-4-dehydrorhamnose 3,5-epimerase